LYEDMDDQNSTEYVQFIADDTSRTYNTGDTVFVTSGNGGIIIPHILTAPLQSYVQTVVETLVINDSTSVLDTVDVITGDTIQILDKHQSLLAFGSQGGNGVWVTRMAHRFAPIWWKVINNISGQTRALEWSKDGDILYVGTSGGVLYRVKGFNSVYFNGQANDTINGIEGHDSVSYNYADVRSGNQQLEVTTILSGSGSISGIAVDPNNPEHVVVTIPGFGSANILRSSTAASTTGTASFSSIKGNLPANIPVLDAIIDVNNPAVIVVGTAFGVYATDNTGSTWTPQNDEIGLLPVYAVRQQWREFSEGVINNGVIYFGTFGGGIWSTNEFASIDHIDNDDLTDHVSNISLFPNPSNNFTNVAFDLNNESDVVINVYSIQGKLMETLSFKNVQQGEVKKQLNVSDYSKGTYLVHVSAGNQNFGITKFMKN